jgi:uncharacterized membrane protein required for colicin V production
MDIPMMIDLAVLVILLFFVIRGVQQGFVRALCSFLAVFVAFFGALYLSKQLTPVATDLLAPQILPSIIEKLESGSEPQTSQDLTSQETGLLLKKIGLPEAWSRLILQANSSADEEQPTLTSPSQILASYILNIILSAAIFVVSFLLLLLLWLILSRSLDLMAKLPILNFCNRTLGALFGLCKALIFLLILRWLLCDWLGQIPSDLLDRTWSFQILSDLFSHIKLPSSLLEFHQFSLR